MTVNSDLCGDESRVGLPLKHSLGTLFIQLRSYIKSVWIDLSDSMNNIVDLMDSCNVSLSSVRFITRE